MYKVEETSEKGQGFLQLAFCNWKEKKVIFCYYFPVSRKKFMTSVFS